MATVFQALQAALNKQTINSGKTPEQIDAAVRQMVSKAILQFDFPYNLK